MGCHVVDIIPFVFILDAIENEMRNSTSVSATRVAGTFKINCRWIHEILKLFSVAGDTKPICYRLKGLLVSNGDGAIEKWDVDWG